MMLPDVYSGAPESARFPEGTHTLLFSYSAARLFAGKAKSRDRIRAVLQSMNAAPDRAAAS